MWGDVAVALIALVGVLGAALLSARDASRERKALREEAEILPLLPESVREDFEKHVVLRSNTYLEEEQKRPSRRAKRIVLVTFSVGVILTAAGAVAGSWDEVLTRAADQDSVSSGLVLLGGMFVGVSFAFQNGRLWKLLALSVLPRKMRDRLYDKYLGSGTSKPTESPEE